MKPFNRMEGRKYGGLFRCNRKKFKNISRKGNMINRYMLLSFFVCAVVAVPVDGQNNTEITPLKALKEVYAGKFLIGTAGDLKGYSEAELANIKKHYDILTPENCMKPQPTHPSEDIYNFTTPDSMVEWCQKNGVKVWGHTLGWY